MSVELGRQNVPGNDCIDDAQFRQAVQQVIESLGNPGVPLDNQGNGVIADPIYITPEGDIISPPNDGSDPGDIANYTNYGPPSGGGGGGGYTAGCGITLTGIVLAFDAANVAGPGLENASGCKLSVDVGCGIKLTGNEVCFDAATVSGDGLKVNSGCTIDVDPGCGIQISDDKVAFKRDDVIGDGLETSGANCKIKVKAGCGIEVNAVDGVGVKNTDLAGVGLSAGTGCKLNVDPDANSIYLELTEDLSYSDNAKLGKPIKADGTLDTAADAVYLIQPGLVSGGKSRWYGLAEYTSITGSTEHGYRFWCRFVTADWNSSGKPGYEIVSGDGPAPMLTVSLTGSWTATDAGYNVDPNESLGGGWAAGRLPKQDTSGGGEILADDPQSLADGASGSDKFTAAWSAADEKYKLFGSPGSAEPFIRIKGKATSAVTRSNGTFTIDNVTAMAGASPVDGSSDTITVTNNPKIKCANNDDVYAIYHGGTWTTADLGNHVLYWQGREDFDSAEFQVFGHDPSDSTGDEFRWLPTTLCNPS